MAKQLLTIAALHMQTYDGLARVALLLEFIRNALCGPYPHMCGVWYAWLALTVQ